MKAALEKGHIERRALPKGYKGWGLARRLRM